MIVGQSLKAAGMVDLERRYVFERAWAARFPSASPDEAETPAASEEEEGVTPRIKPAPSN